MNSPTAFMAYALSEAQAAFNEGEVPVGAVIVHQDTVIARQHNQVETRKNPCAHAEMLAIQEATQVLGDKFLTECTLYVTLEPCAMCAQAISLARIPRLVFGAYDPKSGGVDHGAQVYTHATCHFPPDVIGGVLERDCSLLLQRFFVTLR